jgi:hypothetical protein
MFPHQDTPLWSGPLNATTMPPLLDSPARRELLKHILTGDSVVWVVCTREAEKAQGDRVEKRLRFLEQVAALPPQDPNDPDSQLGPGPPLKLKFSVLRVSLDDPAEKLFAAMVAGPKQQEFVAKGTAFAAPIFAKGRVLGAWALSDLDDTAIEDATLFLIGRCSCRIKNENPGWDVVLKTDWESALKKAGEAVEGDEPNAASPAGTAPPRAISLNGSVRELETYVASAPAAAAPAAAATSAAGSAVVHFASVPIIAVIAGGLALAGAVAGFMLWFRR